MYTFVLIETLGTQDYIFRSNRLPENIGASELVRRATTDWVWEAVHKEKNEKDWKKWLDDLAYDEQTPVENGAAAEVLLTAGGNAQFISKDRETAKKIVWEITRCALKEAPGLHLNVALLDVEVDWQTSYEPPPTEEVCTEPDREKDSREMPRRLLLILATLAEGLRSSRAAALGTGALAGLSVTATCRSTGQPATDWHDEPGETKDGIALQPVCYRISSEVAKKNAATKEAKERLTHDFKDLFRAALLPEGKKMGFVDQLDDLGRTKGESSMLAIVHADGNGIGRFFSESKVSGTMREQIEQIRKSSKEVNKVSLTALATAMQAVVQAISLNEKGKPILATVSDGASVPPLELAFVEKKDSKGTVADAFYAFPVRPIVFGGDDVTVVCDGRIGLAFAEAYIKAFEANAKALSETAGAKVTASAGVAIVKAHYPFAQAYALAEELTKHAKREGTRQHGGLGAMDWHVAESAVYTSEVKRLREREYAVSAGLATMRPVIVTDEDPGTFRSWETVEKGIKGFREAEWAERRSKIKRLADAIREGETATATFLGQFAAYRSAQGKTEVVELPDVGYAQHVARGGALPRDAAEREAMGEELRGNEAEREHAVATSRQTGWAEGHSLYADAVALLDLHLPLTPASSLSEA